MKKKLKKSKPKLQQLPLKQMKRRKKKMTLMMMTTTMMLRKAMQATTWPSSLLKLMMV
jgi:hypothetical protein